ncbi:hypothetical protein BJV82DRAFT_599845 [Fennellomyces sp. T-0311]|nr:hypothetical protein BJV82DRAFT_599845 [Fennellomyces sp. T-0311]
MANGTSHCPRLDPLFGTLPFEITTKIFAYLEQADCLRCMAVCREWYSSVPQCSRDVWTELGIPDDGTLGFNKRLQLCLGDHVESVMFYRFKYETDLYRAMQKLIDAGCSRIKRLGFENCITPRENKFLSVLQPLTQSTRMLTFHGHSFGLTFIDILAICPQLNHFSFTAADFGNPVLRLDDDTPNLCQLKFPHLTRLFVEVLKSDVQWQLAPILQRSPNMRYLGYRNTSPSGNSLYYSELIDLDQLFTWCPKLISLEMNSDMLVNYQDLPLRHDVPDDNVPGLRCFIAHETHLAGADQIGAHLLQHMDTLEYISFGSRTLQRTDWSATLRRLHCPRLRILVCHGIKYYGTAVDDMIRSCPDLEELVVLGDENASFHLPSALRWLTRLKFLNINGIPIDCNDTELFPDNALTELFTQLTSSESQMTELRLRNTWQIAPPPSCQKPPSVVHTAVEHSMIYLPQEYTDDALCHLVNAFSNLEIESLAIANMHEPSNDVIQALSGLPSLETLEMYGRHRFEGFDINLLVQLLQNCTKLRGVSIIGLALAGTEEDIQVFLERNVPRCMVIADDRQIHYYRIALLESE